ncbi:winged helix-turn-helix domain-containing protein [Salinisphaera sp. RV14]|uniref:winged helix-turn-helix domain-containing protein n=1 Tax=unclassified Salinisphaera TaxID=2649847 RepID=UPI003F87E077
MLDPAQYGDWRFSPDFATAVHVATGDALKFTGAERALLGVFVHHANTVLRRERLFDAIVGDDPEISDRKVDYIINSLRRKLRDSATEPRYIATQYGEGYLWVAQRVQTRRPSAGALIVVGPVRGLHFSGHLAEAGWAFLRTLMRQLDRDTAQRHKVTLDLDCPAPECFEGEPPRFAVQVSFVKSADRCLDCAVTLKPFAARVILSVTRLRISAPDPKSLPCGQIAANLARQIIGDIRRSLTYNENAATAPDAQPLAIGLQQAALLFAQSRPQWDKTAEQLEARLRENPNDHQAAAALALAQRRRSMAANRAAEREYRAALRDKPHDPVSQLLLATTLHSKYIFAGRDIFAGPERHRRHADEAEIEERVLAALPKLQDNPVFVLNAAKLLYFVNKAHRPLALELAQDALQQTTAFATGFTTVGQMYAWEARTDEALALYDQALELAPRATDFRLYVQILQCQALTAIGDHDASALVATDMYQNVPSSRAHLGLFFAATDAVDLNATLECMLQVLDMDEIRGRLLYFHYLSVRHFIRQNHRQNLMRWPLAVLMARVGEDCIPDEIRTDMPPGLRSQTG